MIWLVIDNEKSDTIVSCNTHEENGKYQLWVTKINGKTQKIRESENKADIQIIKEAIDYAIEKKETAIRLD